MYLYFKYNSAAQIPNSFPELCQNDTNEFEWKRKKFQIFHTLLSML